MPLTVQCTIHSATKLKTSEPFDFLQSENCLHPISLKSVEYTWLREVQLTVPGSEKAPGQAVGVCVSGGMPPY